MRLAGKFYNMKLETEEKAAVGLVVGMFGCAGLYILSIIALICVVIYVIYRVATHFT